MEKALCLKTLTASVTKRERFTEGKEYEFVEKFEDSDGLNIVLKDNQGEDSTITFHPIEGWAHYFKYPWQIAQEQIKEKENKLMYHHIIN